MCCTRQVMPVRRVEKSDRKAWMRLRLALWPDEEAVHAGEIDRFFLGPVPGLEVAFVADESGKLQGFAELSIRPCAEGCMSERVAYLEGWYVVPEARLRGIGSALVSAAEEWAREKGCTELASDTAPDNEASTRAHVACGFEDVGLVRCFRRVL